MYRPFFFDRIQSREAFCPYDAKWQADALRFAAVGSRADGSGRIKMYEMNGRYLNEKFTIRQNTPYRCCTFDLESMASRYLCVGDFHGELHIM